MWKKHLASPRSHTRDIIDNCRFERQWREIPSFCSLDIHWHEWNWKIHWLSELTQQPDVVPQLGRKCVVDSCGIFNIRFDINSTECGDVIERLSEETGMLPCWAIHLKLLKGRIFGIFLRASRSRLDNCRHSHYVFFLCVGFNDKTAWLLRWRLCSPAPVSWQQSMDEFHLWRSTLCDK